MIFLNYANGGGMNWEIGIDILVIYFIHISVYKNLLY